MNWLVIHATCLNPTNKYYTKKSMHILWFSLNEAQEQAKIICAYRNHSCGCLCKDWLEVGEIIFWSDGNILAGIMVTCMQTSVRTLWTIYLRSVHYKNLPQ